MKIPFLGGAYRSRSSDISSQECINFYYEPPPDGEKHDGSLVSVEGASTFASANRGNINTFPPGGSPSLDDDDTNPVRGAFVYDDATHVGTAGIPSSRRLFFVIKNGLYEYYTATGAPYLRDWGTSSLLPIASNRVTMAGNNFGQIVLAEGSKGLLIEGTTPSVIADPDFVPSDIVVHQDGYFIMTEPGTNRFRYSALHNGTSWPADNYVTAQGRSDTVEALISDRRELWVFGDRSVEVYYNSGDTDIPFQRFQGGYIEMGTIAKFTPQKFDNTVAWLTQNDRGGVQVVRAGNNWTPIIISTPEVSYQMQQYERVDDAFAYVYQYAGHEFYVLTFPSAGVTWGYDALTKQWHRRGHHIDNRLSRERFNCHAFWNNKHLFGDLKNGIVYELDPDKGDLQIGGWDVELYLAASYVAGASRIWLKQVSDNASYNTADKQYYDITLDDGSIHTTMGSEWAPGETALAVALPSAASAGNRVRAYMTVETDSIERIRSSQQISAPNESRSFITQFQIDFDEGVGDGKVWLSYSKDGGHTWSNERERSLGGTGKYAHRVIWRKLGWGRNWRFRVRTWSTDKIVIKGAWARFDGEED